VGYDSEKCSATNVTPGFVTAMMGLPKELLQYPGIKVSTSMPCFEQAVDIYTSAAVTAYLIAEEMGFFDGRLTQRQEATRRWVTLCRVAMHGVPTTNRTDSKSLARRFNWVLRTISAGKWDLIAKHLVDLNDGVKKKVRKDRVVGVQTNVDRIVSMIDAGDFATSQ
jgi:hypothetical protein